MYSWMTAKTSIKTKKKKFVERKKLFRGFFFCSLMWGSLRILQGMSSNRHG